MLLEAAFGVATNWVDIVALVVLAAFFLYGAMKGFMIQLLGIVVLVASLLLASVVSGPLGGWLGGRWTSLTPDTAKYVCFGAVALLALMTGMYVAHLLKGALEKAKVLAYDRLLGGLVGGVKGVLALMIVVNILGYFALPEKKPPEGVAKDILESRTMSAAKWSTEKVLVFLPDHMSSWLRERSVVKGEPGEKQV